MRTNVLTRDKLGMNTYDNGGTGPECKDPLKDALGLERDHGPSLADRIRAGGVHQSYGTSHTP